MFESSRVREFEGSNNFKLFQTIEQSLPPLREKYKHMKRACKIFTPKRIIKIRASSILYL